MALPKLKDENNKEEKEAKETKRPGLPSFDMPSLDDVGDDEFESVDVDDVDDFEDDELNEEIYSEAERVEKRALPAADIEEEPYGYETEDDYNPDYEEDLVRGEEPGTEYVDLDNKEIIPMGGKRSKRKVKSSEFDKRTNTLATTKIIRTVVMIILVILFLLGLKNTFLPSHVYSDDQIRAFAREGAGQTGFPEERGIAYVEGFMETFLTIDRDKPQNKEVLNHYYGEASFANLSGERLRMYASNGSKQHVIISPQVYEVELLTDYAARFKVSTYVSDTNGTEVEDNKATGRWLSFAVNVFYDNKTEGMIITKDSPSIIPTYRILNQSSLPVEAVLGNGRVNEEILPALTPTINGFVKAYAGSSIASHEEILQYIDDKNDINLYDGFGGTVSLNGGPSEAIKKTVYNSDDGIYRVDLDIKWIDNAASQGVHKVEYRSRYVMRIKAIGDGRYVVTSFSPYYYFAQ